MPKKYRVRAKGPFPPGVGPRRKQRGRPQAPTGPRPYMPSPNQKKTKPKKRRKLSDAHRERLKKGAHRYRQRKKWNKRGRIGRFIGRNFYGPLKRKGKGRTGRGKGGFQRRGKRLSMQHRKKISEGVKRAYRSGKMRGRGAGGRRGKKDVHWADMLNKQALKNNPTGQRRGKVKRKPQPVQYKNWSPNSQGTPLRRFGNQQQKPWESRRNF